jgi:excisionase family DNA binding protein
MTVAPRTPARNEPAAPPDPHLLLDEVEIAELLGVSRPTVRAWAAAGLIRAVALPNGMRRKLYRREDVEKWVASLPADGHVSGV